MLQKIYIKNYGIIDELKVEFDAQLNIITGETGAGKSIILGALGLILGERADSSFVLQSAEKCVIEATFDITHNLLIQQVLTDADLDVMPATIIRRELTAAGKSRAFINDTPVNLNTLNKVTSQLVDLHRQFDNLAFSDLSFMYMVMNGVSDAVELYKKYQINYKAYSILKQEAQSLQVIIREQKQNADYKQFLLDELIQADFKNEEIESLQQELIKLENAAGIIAVLQGFHYVMEGQDYAIHNEIKKQVQSLESIHKVYAAVQPLMERLQSCLIELKDISEEIFVMQEAIQTNPEKMLQLKERVDTGYKLLKKHQVNTTVELLSIQARLMEELSSNASMDEDYEQMLIKIAALEKELLALGNELFTKRQQAIEGFENAVNTQLHLIGMPNALFKIDLQNTSRLGEFGLDHIQFLIDTNNSGKYSPIQKTASGGELSRIMLAIKTHTAHALSLPTLIFDEVDTGISGEAAKQVAILLHDLGAHHQIICITHQVQVAAKGQHHLYVYKIKNELGQIVTRVKSLDKAAKVKVIAQMIGGDTPSEAAINNAKELIAAS